MFRCNVSGACALAAAAMVVPAACAGRGVTSSSTSPLTASAPESRVVEVTCSGGQVAGGAQRASARLGQRVLIRVTSQGWRRWC